MCLSLSGTGIPHEKEVLLIDKSFKPFSTKLITSFFLDLGKIKSLFFYNDPIIFLESR